MPAALRILLAALTGAGLSLSFTGFYLQIYSWVAVGLLLILIMGPKPRVAFFLWICARHCICADLGGRGSQPR